MPSYQYSSKAYKQRTTPISKLPAAQRARAEATKARSAEHAALRRAQALTVAARMRMLTKLHMVGNYVEDLSALERAVDVLVRTPPNASSAAIQQRFNAAQRELAIAFGLRTARE